MAGNRTITSVLRAETAAYQRDMQAAAKATEAVGDAGVKASSQGRTGFQQLAESARQNRAEWTELGQTLTGVGAVMAGLGGSVLAVGISYNTLQQQSRAALTSLTGSAEAANRQMDRLDAFAVNSPFAKDVFIKAQQQMLGFGIEAQKVIPYLDAIQNAVAAAGGGNHDIAELSRIMSQISASAKITATDLREFGNRGIDAATLIGSQMGMTGAEIRESITAGTLDAGAALDALAAGMSERFDGAAAGVKDTMVGAFDRVKAAFRDLASEMAKPLVDPEGGGALVSVANAAADFLRALQALPGPVKTAGGAIFGIVTAATLAGGAFLMLAPRIQSAVAAAKALGPQFLAAGKSMMTVQNAIRGMTRTGVMLGGVALAASDLGDKFEYTNTVAGGMMGMLAGPWGAAVGAATGFIMDYAKGQGDAARDTSGLTASLDEQTGALTENSAAWVATELGKARGEFEALGISANEVTQAIMEGGPALDDMVARLEAMKPDLEFGDIGGMVSKGNIMALQSLIEGLGSDVADVREEFNEIQGAATEAGAGISAGMEIGAAGVDAFATSLRDSLDAMRALRDEAIGGINAQLKYAEELNNSRAAATEYAGVLKGVKRGQTNLTAEQIAAKKTLSEQAAAWNGLNDEAQNAPGAFKSARKALVDTATQMGMTRGDAKALAAEILNIPSQRHTKVSLEGKDAAIGAAAAIGLALDRAARPRTAYIGVAGPGVGAGALGRADGGTITRYDTGGTVAGQRQPYGDKVLAYLAPGEEVISNRFGQADRHRDLLKAINANSFADGGTIQGLANGGTAGGGVTRLGAQMALLATSLKRLRQQLKQSEKALDSARRRRDDLKATRDAMADAIKSSYMSNLFQQPDSIWGAGATKSPLATLSADVDDLIALNKARRQLVQKGVTGSALDAILTEGSLADVQAMAGWSKADLKAYDAMFNLRESVANQVSTKSAEAAYGKELKTLNQRVKGLRQDNKALQKIVRQAGKNAKAGRKGESARAGRNRR